MRTREKHTSLSPSPDVEHNSQLPQLPATVPDYDINVNHEFCHPFYPLNLGGCFNPVGLDMCHVQLWFRFIKSLKDYG